MDELTLVTLREGLRVDCRVFNHAYDLQLDREKLALLLKYADQVAPELEGLVRRFVELVARQEGLPDSY